MAMMVFDLQGLPILNHPRQDPGKFRWHPDPKSGQIERFSASRPDLFTEQIWTDGPTKCPKASAGSRWGGIIGLAARSGIQTNRCLLDVQNFLSSTRPTMGISVRNQTEDIHRDRWF